MNREIQERIAAVEQGLRFRVHIKQAPNKKMNLIDRMAHYKIPGLSVALINNGVIEWSKGYGTVSSTSSVPITADTLFQAASISKLVTTLGVLKLVHAGKVSLDHDVNLYLKSWKLPENEFTHTQKVTLRHLLTHSAGTTVSGFPGYATEDPLPSLIHILDGVAPANTQPIRVQHTPGTTLQYSGGGTTIVQKIIEDVTSMPFDQWMKEEVLEVFGMKISTYQQPLPKTLSNFAADGHLISGEPLQGHCHIYPEMAAAGLWSTPTELAHLAIALQTIASSSSGDLEAFSLVKEMFKPQRLIHGKLYTGLGAFIHLNKHGSVFEHSGLNHGFSARLTMTSHSGQGLVLMANGDVNAWYLLEECIHSIADTYHWPDFEPVIKTAISFNVDHYQHYIGKFYSKEDPKDYAEIYRIDNTLFMKADPDTIGLQLHLKAKNIFFTIEENQTISFKQYSDTQCELMIHFEDDQIRGQNFTYYKNDLPPI